MPKKRKSATALFEVMSTSKPMERVTRSRGWLESPTWATIFKSILERKPKLGRPEPVRVIHREVHRDVQGEVHRETHRESPAPSAAVEYHAVPAAPRQPREAGVPWYNRLPFKLDATNSVIAGSAIVIVLGLGLLIAVKFRHESMPTLSALSTTDLRKQPARPSVLDIPRRAATVAPAPQVADQVADTAPAEKTTPSQPGKRIINMNYLMIQSFNDEKLTREAADVLNKNGIECTVIAGLPRWAPSPRWFCIVGTKGFGPYTTDTAEYQNYLQKIKQVSVTFAGKNKWKQFSPQLYRWGADSEK